MSVQWVHLPDGNTLVAGSDGAWIQRPVIAALGLRFPMTDCIRTTSQTTRHLLDGAIAAAERNAPAPQPTPMTATRWTWQLMGQWYCAHHSVALLPTVASRYDSAGRRDLARFARRKLEEELGHDQFPLDDLRGLGHDAQALVRAVAPPPAARACVEYARACARGDHPVDLLGYVYALERRVIRVPDQWLTDLETVLPSGVDAVSAIRLHAMDLDLEHVDEAIRFIAALPAGDRTRVAQACYRTTEICCAAFPDDNPTEAELERRFRQYPPPRVTSELRRPLATQGDRT